MIPTFTRAYEASAAIEAHRIVEFSDVAASRKIAQADSNTSPLMGVSDVIGADLGGMCDVHRGGTVTVKLGGTVSAGDPLTSDASGMAIAAAAAAATTVRIIGYADEPGVSGDLIDVFFSPGVLHQG